MQAKRNLVALAIAILAAAVAAGCTTTSTPVKTEAPDWRYHDIVDVAFVQEHVKIPMAEGVMLIDARPKRPKYDKGHIPMAVSIPDSKFAKMTDRLPKEKSALLIFYCGGPT
jgi:3-mercaptopyruvate sulfurtransferase SseA